MGGEGASCLKPSKCRCRRAGMARFQGSAAGHAAIELVASVGLLLLPVVMLVAALPTWSERRHVAIVAAREASVVAAQGYPRDVSHEAELIAESIASAHGVAPEDIRVDVRTDLQRGGSVTATVTVRMPAMEIPGIGRVGAWSWSTTHTRRIDDYRSGG